MKFKTAVIILLAAAGTLGVAFVFQRPPAQEVSDVPGAPNTIIQLNVSQASLELAKQGKSFEVSVDISGSFEAVKVEYLLDGKVVAVSHTPPFTAQIDLSQVAPGEHTLQAVAYNMEGKRAKSKVFRFVVEASGEVAPAGEESESIVRDTASRAAIKPPPSQSTGSSSGTTPGGGDETPPPEPEPEPEPTWPTTASAQICGNNTLLGGGPTSAPAGAITVPAGNNNSMFFILRQPDKVFWFAPGVHTLDFDEFGQIEPGSGSTYIGAPGAILDGQGINRAAFTQQAANVTIKYLTIRNFDAALDQGVVNHDAGPGWTIEYNTVIDNEGAGLMAGPNNTYRYNCIQDNGQYGINSCCGGDSDSTDIQNFVLDSNEIVGNNTGDWETVNPGCGCTGAVKFWLNKNVDVTNNWVHDNRGTALWLDNNNRGFVIEKNVIEDNDGSGIFVEAGYDARIRYNNLRRNAYVVGRDFAANLDPFPIGAIYISEAGAPSGYGLKTSPMLIRKNNFENNWGGVEMWENADRYSGSSAHTHVSGTIKIGDLYSDDQCDGPSDTILVSVGDKFKCRWSTENIIVEENEFHLDKAAIGTGCVGQNFCGISGIFSNFGSYPEFDGYTIPWRITFQQGNIFRNNHYFGDWHFAGFQTTTPNGPRVKWEDWTAPAPSVPPVFTNDNRPETFGQDVGSTKQ